MMKTKFFILFFGLVTQIIFSQCWVSIKSNGFNTVGLTSNGDLYVWGANNYGQLGNGTTTQNNNPSYFSNQTVWKDISIAETSFAIKNDGTLWVWGSNAQPSSPIFQTLPIQMGIDNDWKKLSCRYSHSSPTRSLALKTNGTLWDLGNYGAGNLITQVGTDNDWKYIYTGNGFSFAIKSNGTLWSWGQNTNGQLGDGTTINKATPTQVGNDNNWKFISTSDQLVFGFKNDGTLWRWGVFDGLQYLSPIQVGTENNWKDITTMNQAMLAIKNDGTLWGWGENWHGGLGNGTNTSLISLTQIGTDTNWLSISAGAGHVTALKSDNSLWTWGWNFYGSLGNGTTTNSNVPIQISCNTLSVTSVLNSTISSVKIYPNPIKTNFTVLNENNFKKTFYYKIIDFNGRNLKSGSSQFNEQINIESLTRGNYIIQIENEKGEKLIEKLIKN